MLPFISAIESNSFIIIVTPLLTVDFTSIEECTLSSLEELSFSSSPLPQFPYLQHLSSSNLLRVSSYFFLMDSHTLLYPIQKSNTFYTKHILRIPKLDKDPISVYPYPDSGELKSGEMSRLLREGEIEPARRK